MKILVTGGAGFIGSHLAEKLSIVGHEVTVIDSLSNFLYPRKLKELNLKKFQPLGIKFFELDLVKDDIEEIVTSQEIIINQAAIPGLVKSWSHLENYVYSNLFALGRLLDVVKSSNLKRFIQISTSSVYGQNATGSEKSILEPFSPYGVSKLAAEKLALAYQGNFDLPLTILRYYSVYGPRQRPDMAYQKFIKAILNGQQIEIYGDGSQIRTNTYVDDVVSGTLSVIDKLSLSNGKTYNISGDESVTLLEALEIIQDKLRIKANLVFTAPRYGDQVKTNGNIEEAKRELGFKPIVKFSEGIQRQIDWNFEMRQYLDEEV